MHAEPIMSERFSMTPGPSTLHFNFIATTEQPHDLAHDALLPSTTSPALHSADTMLATTRQAALALRGTPTAYQPPREWQKY